MSNEQMSAKDAAFVIGIMLLMAYFFAASATAEPVRVEKEYRGVKYTGVDCSDCTIVGKVWYAPLHVPGYVLRAGLETVEFIVELVEYSERAFEELMFKK